MKEASGPRVGRATWSPICDPLLESWRHNSRDWLARLYAFAVPNTAALAELSTHAPIVEIGAGTGYWASQLKNMGVDVVAYDVKPPASSSASSASSAGDTRVDGGVVNGSSMEKEQQQSRKKRENKAKKKRKHQRFGPTPNEYHGKVFFSFSKILSFSPI